MTGAAAKRWEALDLLAVAYYVLAALSGLVALGVIAMVLLVAVPASDETADLAAEETAVLGCMIGFILVVSVGSTLLFAVAGRRLRRRRGWKFCVVTAALSLLILPPLGTVVGTVALVVLLSDQGTRAQFERSVAATGPTAGTMPT